MIAALSTAFAGGLLSGFGPCAAPRIAIVLALADKASGLQRSLRAACFVLGIVAGYVCLGVVAGAAAAIGRYASIAYAVLAIWLFAQGLRQILKPIETHACASECRDASAGAAFVAGLACTAVASPCCLPLAASVAAAAATTGSQAGGVLVLLAFAVGHGAAIAAFASISGRLSQIVERYRVRSAASTVSGGLMLAAAGYYSILV
jgi:cytochrome c biogenesis protein CcdA